MSLYIFILSSDEILSNKMSENKTLFISTIWKKKYFYTEQNIVKHVKILYSTLKKIHYLSRHLSVDCKFID